MLYVKLVYCMYIQFLSLRPFYKSLENISTDLNRSSSQSTARMSATSSAGSPTVSSTMIMVTRPACGIPAAPIEAAVAVMLTATTLPKSSGISRTCNY